MSNSFPVRYPVGKNFSKNCIGAFLEEKEPVTLLNYIDSRKQIYLPIYCDLAKKAPRYSLLEKLHQGENLLIIEVDGPHQESLKYYQDKYQVASDFITNDTMLVTVDNLKIMLNDPIHPFGHGYCLAAALLGLDEEIVKN